MSRFDRLPAGALLCSIIGYGMPMHVDFLGPQSFTDILPVAVTLGVMAAATVWMFRRFGGATRPTLPSETSEAMWRELEHAEHLADSDDAAVDSEPERSSQPVG